MILGWGLLVVFGTSSRRTGTSLAATSRVTLGEGHRDLCRSLGWTDLVEIAEAPWVEVGANPRETWG